MKITISFLPGEFRAVAALRAFVTVLLPGAKVRESEKHPPYKQIYITTKRPTREGMTHE